MNVSWQRKTIALLTALLGLTLLELICFGPIVRKVGFYLDDWFTLCMFHWTPKQPWPCFLFYLTHDPRVTARPVEAAFFTANYLLFGAKPLGYHLINGMLEISAAWFLFLTIRTLMCGRSVLAWIAAAVFLLYPNHDASHYWATCNSETLSAALCLASLWMAIQGVRKEQVIYILGSAACFLLSVFCYETFLPVVAANFVCALILAQKRQRLKQCRHLLILLPALYVGSVAALLFYTRAFLPPGAAQVHQIKFDLQTMVHIIGTGIWLNTPSGCMPFFVEQAQHCLSANPVDAALAVAATSLICTLVLSFLLREDNRLSVEAGASSSEWGRWLLAGLGACIVVVSYSIFGLNAEYVPRLDSLLNRINFGAAIGMAIIIGSGLSFLCCSKELKRTIAGASAVALVVSSLTLTNRGLSQPWVLSWQTQRIIFEALKCQQGMVPHNAGLLLANCPRYVMWSPMFDGVWDFSSMVKLALRDDTINGGVVSERMMISDHSVRDVSCGSICGDYPFARCYVILPPSFHPVPVRNARQFIELIRTRGRQFGLSEKTISSWYRQLAASPKAKAM